MMAEALFMLWLVLNLSLVVLFVWLWIRYAEMRRRAALKAEGIFGEVYLLHQRGKASSDTKVSFDLGEASTYEADEVRTALQSKRGVTFVDLKQEPDGSFQLDVKFDYRKWV